MLYATRELGLGPATIGLIFAAGGAVGLRPALLVCAIGALLSPLPAVFSPLRRLREQQAG